MEEQWYIDRRRFVSYWLPSMCWPESVKFSVGRQSGLYLLHNYMIPKQNSFFGLTFGMVDIFLFSYYRKLLNLIGPLAVLFANGLIDYPI
jgi:hypothetical protein